ncbi:hypothetical protein AB0D08_07545 [Kitasatospora sp. NPDC048540]|uniref:hypothetical protein n=1 Tax=Kitasatospora sp. NPDC048540 TaxID=3155634 RepID=UPI0033EBDCBE
MSAPTGEAAGRRVEEILDRLAADGDPKAAAAAEELVRVLMDFYGAGLARAVELLSAGAHDPDRPAAGPLAELLDDQLVAGLLVLHDLHPEDTVGRLERAVRQVPGAALASFDPASGVLRVRVENSGSGCGCSGGADDGRAAVAELVAVFAPEVTAVELEPAGPKEPALLQIGLRPGLQPAEAR